MKKQEKQGQQKVDVSGKYIALPAEVIIATVNYLQTKSFQEVGELIPAINSQAMLIEKPEAPKDPSELKKPAPAKRGRKPKLEKAK